MWEFWKQKSLMRLGICFKILDLNFCITNVKISAKFRIETSLAFLHEKKCWSWSVCFKISLVKILTPFFTPTPRYRPKCVQNTNLAHNFLYSTILSQIFSNLLGWWTVARVFHRIFSRLINLNFVIGVYWLTIIVIENNWQKLKVFN